MAEQHVVFLACAGELPGVKQECWDLKDILKRLKSNGHLGEAIIEERASVDRIFRVFEEYRDRIAIFHFAGHADPGRLIMESAFNAKAAYAEGLATLLGQQRCLKLAFLNGCSTRPQVLRLLNAGVPAVIATARPINDAVARDFAVAFYQALTTGGDGIDGGRSLLAAFRAAEGFVKFSHTSKIRSLSAASPASGGVVATSPRGSASMHGDWPRSLYFAMAAPEDITDAEGFPWELRVRKGSEQVERWNLFDDEPLFGLPELPDSIGLPDEPFRNLDRFAEEHARIFFGRGRAIRELYDLITRPPKPGDAPVILYFGQTGVGKSSVLAAGVVPRLRAKYKVYYVRRDPTLGLLGTLAAELAPGSDRFNLGRAWSDIEKDHPDRPLIVILDQAEEAYTRPLSRPVAQDGAGDASAPDVANTEIVALFKDVRSAFDPQCRDRPRGKLILGFRNEWLGEFEKACRAFQLAYEPMPLGALDRDGVIGAVEGIVREPDLVAKRARYRLTITPVAPSRPTLAEFMADDLRDRLDEPSASEVSPIAPTLQLLLTRMWEAAKACANGDPVLDAKLYDEMKKSGFELDEVLARQFGQIERLGGDEVSSWLGEMARSGLLLDLLEAFTTPLGTAATRTRLDLHARYRLQPAECIDALLDQCKNRYLVAGVKVAAADAGYRLSHDILAPLIRERFRTSIKPAQRARRLLESRAPEWNGKADGPAFDRTDLWAVEEGLRWMRGLEGDEFRLLEASRQAEARRGAEDEERQRRVRQAEEEAKRELEGRLRAEEDARIQAQQRAEDQKKSYGKLRRATIALGTLLVTVLVVAIFAGYEWTQENKQRGIAESKTQSASAQTLLARERLADVFLGAIGQSDGPLTDAEKQALRALSEQTDQEVRFLVFERGLQTPKFATALRNRAAFMVHDAVRDDQVVRGRVQALLLKTMQAEAEASSAVLPIRLACVDLGRFLGSTELSGGEVFAIRALDALIDAALQKVPVDDSSESLQRFGFRMTPSSADALARTIIGHAATAEPVQLSNLARIAAALRPRLANEAAQQLANAIVRRAAERMWVNGVLAPHSDLSRSLRAVAPMLSETDATRAFHTILVYMRSTDYHTKYIAEQLIVLSQPLGSQSADSVGRTIVELAPAAGMSYQGQHNQNWEMANVLKVLAPKLSRQVATAAVRKLLRQFEERVISEGDMALSLAELVKRLGPPEADSVMPALSKFLSDAEPFRLFDGYGPLCQAASTLGPKLSPEAADAAAHEIERIIEQWESEPRANSDPNRIEALSGTIVSLPAGAGERAAELATGRIRMLLNDIRFVSDYEHLFEAFRHLRPRLSGTTSAELARRFPSHLESNLRRINPADTVSSHGFIKSATDISSEEAESIAQDTRSIIDRVERAAPSSGDKELLSLAEALAALPSGSGGMGIRKAADAVARRALALNQEDQSKVYGASAIGALPAIPGVASIEQAADAIARKTVDLIPKPDPDRPRRRRWRKLLPSPYFNGPVFKDDFDATLNVLAPKLGQAAADEIAPTLLARISDADIDELPDLVRALGAIAPKLSVWTADSASRAMMDLIISIDPVSGEERDLSLLRTTDESLVSLTTALDRESLIRLARDPLCAGRVQQTVLSALSAKVHPSPAPPFADWWDFVRWRESVQAPGE